MSLKRDISLTVVSALVGAGVGLGIVMYDRLTKSQGQDQNEGQRQDVLSPCTCLETEHIKCKCHDNVLIAKICKILPTESLLYEVGTILEVNDNVLDACREDNKSSINLAVFDMLRKWYKTQDGLGRNSEGLKRLEAALCKVNRGNEIRTVLRNHFDER